MPLAERLKAIIKISTSVTEKRKEIKKRLRTNNDILNSEYIQKLRMIKQTKKELDNLFNKIAEIVNEYIRIHLK